MWGSPISSCTNFCRPRTKVQFHLFHCSISHFARFRKEQHQWWKISKHEKISKNTHRHTRTHFKNQKQCFFVFSFMFAVKFFYKKSAPAIHRLINFRKGPSFNFRIQATGSAANMPLWILQAPPWAQVTRWITGFRSMHPRWTPPGGGLKVKSWDEVKKNVIKLVPDFSCMLLDVWKISDVFDTCWLYIERMDVEVHFLHSEDNGRD